jgi:hypothetical protein
MQEMSMCRIEKYEVQTYHVRRASQCFAGLAGALLNFRITEVTTP